MNYMLIDPYGHCVGTYDNLDDAVKAYQKLRDEFKQYYTEIEGYDPNDPLNDWPALFVQIF